ncbi:MAG: NADH-quinone oxidoreductase subunit NuoG [Sphingomonadaceae bacterium]
MADLIRVTIDGREALVPKGTLVVDAAKQVGIEIPVFCYHGKMHPVGACRMCLVEIEKVPRLQTACTTPVTDGMVVKTNTPAVEKARKGVLEFLLTNHPLDCPVCDKGGECPLQDTTFTYASDRSRFGEEKRHFEKPIRLSELIVLDRERCIMCTRCVRFQREIAGDESLTLISRGSRSYVGVMPGRSFDSPFSGNTIELCPVGALTSALFRFKARSWELKKAPSVCSQCSVGCNVKVESRNDVVLRLTSRENGEVDDGWLCDRGRFTYQFLNDPGRLVTPLVRRGGKLVASTWDDALDTVVRRLRQISLSTGGESIGGMVSPRATNEEMYLFQKLLRTVLGSNNVDHGLHGSYSRPEVGLDAAIGSIAGLETARVILLAGVDPLTDQPVLDLRLKKAARKGARLIGMGARETDLSKLSSPWLILPEGSEAAVVNGLLRLILSEGLVGDAAEARLGERYGDLARDVAEYTPERVQEIAGVPPESLAGIARALVGAQGAAILFPRPLPGAPAGLQEACGRLAVALGVLEGSGALLPLSSECNSQGAIDMGILPKLLPGQQEAIPAGLSGLQMVEAAAAGRLKALYLVGLDLAGQGGDRVRDALSRLDLLVVQDILMTPTAEIADVVLPGAAFAEKEGSFTNLERRVQRLEAAVSPPGEARPDWQVLSDIARGLGAGWSCTRPSEVFDEIAASVPLYGKLGWSRLGSRGKRWDYPGIEEVDASRNGRERKLWYGPLRAEETGA